MWDHLTLIYSNNISHLYDMIMEYYGLKQNETNPNQLVVAKFLGGLCLEYDGVYNQILERNELLTLKEAYQRVSHDLLDHSIPKTTSFIHYLLFIFVLKLRINLARIFEYFVFIMQKDILIHILHNIRHHSSICIFLVVYVNDIVITRSDSIGISQLKTFL
ncbi:unnamed protein product [Spirodela intermedia]|uniref:Uncharacterized protein n=1 Tax=Spirodela intermedia TaxID=51605 RepID=A0A7I8IIW0_SPIIN|nr:unnamed protein product [Spirodela intermedia]CAA6657807.1 unnamed protein product [Spirodela intermedia]